MATLDTPSDDFDPCEVIEAVYKLAPTCEECGSKRLHICLEAACPRWSVFCADCSVADRHFLHRTNELKVLFLTNQRKKHYSEIVSEKLGQLRSFLKGQRARSEDIIKEHMGLVDKITRNIHEIDRLRENGRTESKLASAHQTIRDYLDRRLAFKPAQAQFAKCVGQLDLDPDTEREFSTFRETLAYLRLFQESPCRKTEANYGAATAAAIAEMLSLNKEYSIEKDFRANFAGAYVHSVHDAHRTPFETNMVCKSRACHFGEVSSLFSGRRLLVEDSDNAAQYYGKKIESVPPQLLELHTTFELTHFPQHLRSLTFSVDKYSQNISKDLMKSFPESLRTLRMRVSSTPSLKHSLYLTHLRSLKYFAYSDCAPTAPLLKSIVRFAISNDMRMLCILNGGRYMTYGRQLTWEPRIESMDLHRFPKLRRHYIVYRRKILQLLLIHRRAALANLGTWPREEILETIAGPVDFELEAEEHLSQNRS